MNPAVALATARRILAQLRHDRSTVALLMLAPSVEIVLLRYVFDSPRVFNHVAPGLLGIFPFMMMFIVTSITTLRERTTGTLERLMTMPISKLDLLLGYAIAFGLLAVAQVTFLMVLCLSWLGLTVIGSAWLLLLIAVLDALLGTALGLFVSAFARTEFQAVQFMPAVVLPQVLLCGLLVPRDQMAGFLNWVSNLLPLSYAVDAMTRVTVSAHPGGAVALDLLVVGGTTVLALLLGAVTLRRQSS